MVDMGHIPLEVYALAREVAKDTTDRPVGEDRPERALLVVTMEASERYD